MHGFHPPLFPTFPSPGWKNAALAQKMEEREQRIKNHLALAANGGWGPCTRGRGLLATTFSFPVLAASYLELVKQLPLASFLAALPFVSMEV